ncbi:MAG TPA: prepilin peptidase [Symbiobacteriaceae bacterium]|nr:prepilin peptidase [Symbiobacteriaceae bacterium]
MLEAFAPYDKLNPAMLGFLLFLLGTVTGSFASVVYHRLLSGQSIVLPRSHCPQCKHTLGAADLIPLLSYALTRGKCRHCSGAVHWRYPLLEAGSGGLAALAGATAGPVVGMACLTLVPAGAFLLSLVQRRREFSRSSQAGVTLIEVLAAVVILGIALMPALDTLTVGRRAGRAAEDRSVTMGLARARLSELAAVGATQPVSALDAYNGTNVTGETLSGDAAFARFKISTAVQTGDLAQLRRITVTVTCPDCTLLGGTPIRPVTVSTVVEGM